MTRGRDAPVMLNAAVIETPQQNDGRRRRGADDTRSLRLVEKRREREARDYYERALLLWPRLDRARLGRVRHDRDRLAVLIARRTALALDAIERLLDAHEGRDAGIDAPAS